MAKYQLTKITCPDCKKALGEVISGGKIACPECTRKKKELVWGSN